MAQSKDEDFVRAVQDADKVTKRVTGLLIQTRDTIVRLKALDMKVRATATPDEQRALDQTVKDVSERFDLVADDMRQILNQMTLVHDLQALFFRLIAMQGVMTKVTELHHDIEKTIDDIQDRIGDSGFDDIGTQESMDDESHGQENNQ